MQKIISSLLFFTCLFTHSIVLAGNLSFLVPVHMILFDDDEAPVDPPEQFYTLTADISGSGTGTINSTPVGISCGTDCSEDYLSGTQVTLTATPAIDNTFIGWSGDCTGSGTCSVSMDMAKSVSAQFSANIIETEPNDGFLTAEILGFDTTITGRITGAILTSNPDWYKVSSPDARTVTVRFNATNNSGRDDLYWLIRVYKADGTSLLTEYVVMSSYEAFNVDLPEAGDYYFVVRARGIDGDGPTDNDDYNLIIFSNDTNPDVGPGEKEANNNKASANGLEFDTAITGSLMSKTDEDWYQVSNSSASPITATMAVTTSSNYDSWVVTVYSESDQTIARLQVRNGSRCNVVIPAGGSYYFVVTDFILISGEAATLYNGSPYTLTVENNSATVMPTIEDEDNVDRAHATFVTDMNVGFTGQSALTDTGDQDEPSDTDYFSFHNHTAGQMSFEVENDAVNPDLDFWELTLEAADGTNIPLYYYGFTVVAGSSVNSGDKRTSSVALAADTTYYIKLKHDTITPSSIEYRIVRIP